MPPAQEEGYLVLADVSGYTGFVAGTELEHATAVLSELIQTMLDGLSPPLELAAVEGDAVFVHGPANVVARGETLLELIDATYSAFRARRGIMAARTTCPCAACRGVDSLDVKFITHFGGFVRQELGGQPTPIGNDVNLVHRLLKNGVESETGWRGYALFTDSALASLGLEADGMHRRAEEYEHLGSVSMAIVDLDARWSARPAGEPPLPGVSHWSAEIDLPVPPPAVWEWLHDPRLRERWTSEPPRDPAHAIVDWKPYEFFSEELRPRAGVRTLRSWRLSASNGGTRLRLDVDLSAPLPTVLRRWLCRSYAQRQLQADLDRLERSIMVEAA